MRKALFGLATLAISAQGQKFGFGIGVKGGFPFTDLLQTVSGSTITLSSGDNYLVGPAVELRLPFGFAIEADGLYRGTQYHLASGGGALPTAFNSASWEIPYLAKFRFPIPLLKPFVEAGGAYRTFTDLPSGVSPGHNAFVAGGGLELVIKRVRLSGEARYLHWQQSTNNLAVRLASNQGEVLFGLMF